MFHAYIIPIATCFIHTFISFYAFSGTNLLTRCHSASCLFSAVFGFRKVVKEIFSELDKRNVKVLIFPRRFQNTEEDTKEDPEGPTHPPDAGPPGCASTGQRSARARASTANPCFSRTWQPAPRRLSVDKLYSKKHRLAAAPVKLLIVNEY